MLSATACCLKLVTTLTTGGSALLRLTPGVGTSASHLNSTLSRWWPSTNLAVALLADQAMEPQQQPASTQPQQAQQMELMPSFQPDEQPAQHQAEQWTPQQEHFMKLALQQARVALKMREIPIGCVVVRGDKVIGTGYNLTNHTRNATRHAELEVIDNISADHDGDLSKADLGSCQLYVTIEPCIMCASALSLLGFGEVIFGAGNDKFGGCGSILSVDKMGCGCCSGSEDAAPHGKPFVARGGLLADQAIQLLQQFYIAGNPLAPKPKRAVMEVPPWEQQEASWQRHKQPQQQQQHQQEVAQQQVPPLSQQQQQQRPSQQDEQPQKVVVQQVQLPPPPQQHDVHEHTDQQLAVA